MLLLSRPWSGREREKKEGTRLSNMECLNTDASIKARLHSSDFGFAWIQRVGPGTSSHHGTG